MFRGVKKRCLYAESIYRPTKGGEWELLQLCEGGVRRVDVSLLSTSYSRLWSRISPVKG